MDPLIDEQIIAADAREPRAAWGLQSGAHYWQPGRMLPSEADSLLQLQCLGLYQGAKVLECAAGVGWMTALLSGLGARLCITEESTANWRNLKERLDSRIAIGRMKTLNGWPAACPFNCILVTEVIHQEPVSLRTQLADGGRLLYWMPERNGLSLLLDVRETSGLRHERLSFTSLESGL